MHILHILDHSLPLHSGYTFRSYNIFRAQSQKGWQVTVLTSPKHQQSWKGKWNLFENLEGFPHYRTNLTDSLPIDGYKEYRLISALRRRMHEVVSITRPDIIHAHSPVLNAFPAFRVGKQFRIPVVYEIRAFWEDAAVDHNSYRENSWKYRMVRALETRACRKADRVTVICSGLRNELIHRGIPRDKLTIIPNGFNDNDFMESPPNEEMIAEWNLKNRKVIGFLGSFYRYEGLDLLLEAFASISGKNEDCVLLLVGGGEMEKELKEKIKALELPGKVIMPGRVSHNLMPSVYALTDILVYPRYSMRLTELVTPLKPLEAMAMRKVVIASDVGGHKELIRDGETGILFQAGNVSALANAIEKSLADENLRKKLTERAFQWVHQERPWEKTTMAYEDVYSKALQISFK
ncbi:MAG: glycosyltransferase, exosortase A system-associated [Acidobacteria bacterium]|nr:glycosyltransferase, exosortase A system-associated [Acidobacteriota bacterium]